MRCRSPSVQFDQAVPAPNPDKLKKSNDEAKQLRGRSRRSKLQGLAKISSSLSLGTRAGEMVTDTSGFTGILT